MNLSAKNSGFNKVELLLLLSLMSTNRPNQKSPTNKYNR